MSVKTWIEGSGGMYVTTPTRGAMRGKKTYYARIWLKEEKRFRHFYLGTKERAAKKKMGGIYNDPEKAMIERQRRKESRAARGLTFGALLDTFLSKYRTRGGTDYPAHVTRAARRLLGMKAVTTITPDVLDRYLSARRSEKTKGVPRVVNGKKVMVGAGRRRIGESTLRKEIIALGKVFKWARHRGLVTVNPLIDYERPKEQEGSPARALTYAEEDAILGLLPPLERDVVAWALDSGMRRGEVLALTWPRIDRAAGLIHVTGTKTGKIRTIPLSLSDRLPAILARHPQRIGAPLVFHDAARKPLDVDRLDGMLEAAMKAAGVPKIRGSLWNVLRKTWVSRLYASGKVLPQQEADWAGHGIAIAMKHYRDHSPAARAGAVGLLNRPGNVTAPPTAPRDSEDSVSP